MNDTTPTPPPATNSLIPFFKALTLSILLTPLIGALLLCLEKDPRSRAFTILGIGCGTLIQAIAITIALATLNQYGKEMCQTVATLILPFLGSTKSQTSVFTNQPQQQLITNSTLGGGGGGGGAIPLPMKPVDENREACIKVITTGFNYFCIGTAVYFLLALGTITAGTQLTRHLKNVEKLRFERKASNFIRPDRTRSIAAASPVFGGIAGKLA
ncbi:hypothetical protein BDR26DRAFT_863783 [Obelidium mucronatum]|nr:hypothetical protein BDR26DRAFT_863783 [Obelidium mucronatum]